MVPPLIPILLIPESTVLSSTFKGKVLIKKTKHKLFVIGIAALIGDGLVLDLKLLPVASTVMSQCKKPAIRNIDKG